MKHIRCLLLVPLAMTGVTRGDEPKSPSPTDLAAYDSLVRPRDREHWAFQPVRRSTVPDVKNTGWVRNSIDAFVLAKLESRGWKSPPPANPRQLLRRLFLDVVGVPPTIAEQESFLK